MRNRDFNSLCEYVKNADKNDAIWYAGYLWIDLTEKQIDKIIRIVDSGSACFKRTIHSVILDRDVLVTPSGMELYGNHDKVFSNIKDVIDGCTEKVACELLFGLYNSNFITCGEYRFLYDWIEQHTDGNGVVLKNWY